MFKYLKATHLFVVGDISQFDSTDKKNSYCIEMLWITENSYLNINTIHQKIWWVDRLKHIHNLRKRMWEYNKNS